MVAAQAVGSIPWTRMKTRWGDSTFPLQLGPTSREGQGNPCLSVWKLGCQ